ncbi:MAG: ATPase [Gemmatimonadales bacterium]|nr:MAG: ATPase [Gemmatimonadales bacterium]
MHPHTHIAPAEQLREILRRIDGRSYKAYQDIRGSWQLDDMTLVVDHVQGDPFAAPSRARLFLSPGLVDFPPDLLSSPSRILGVEARLAREFARRAASTTRKMGSGRSGEIQMEAPGQEVLEGTAVRIAADGGVEARFRVGLPARGRRIQGRQAEELLLEALPLLARNSLLARSFEPGDLRLHAETNEDAEALRTGLADAGLVAFVADGAVLPRSSGIDDRPMEGSAVVPFRAPETLRTTLATPNGGPVSGMGIPHGVTLIVGGGFHGKSTLLRALERGVYNHRPGDGRERVVTAPGAVKIRAEDGRSVAGVNISPFIDTLPGDRDTRRFSTSDASGSTSQAAALVEALEVGASALLMDEDTSATNFMIRDRRMQVLVPREGEPITPFIDRVCELHDELGVSSVLVMGGSGDYLDVADTVIAMRDYRASDVTERARAVAMEHPTGRLREIPHPLAGALDEELRRPIPESLRPTSRRGRIKLKVRGDDEIVFGTEAIDLAAVDQLVSWSQTRAVSEALLLASSRVVDGHGTVAQVVDRVMAILDEEGLDALGHGHDGDLSRFRRYEFAAALNRLRSLRIS